MYTPTTETHHTTNRRLRLGLVGFDLAAGDAFRQAGYNVAAHIYANRKNKLKRIRDRPECLNFHQWKAFDWPTPEPVGLTASNISELKEEGFDVFLRCVSRWDWARQFVHDWTDLNHLFKLACEHAAAWLQRHSVEAVVYSNVPHQGAAIAQYYVARYFGIPTYIFLQSPFPGKSWMIRDWRELGSFDFIRPGTGFEIDTSEPIAPPFYMNKVKSNFALKVSATLQLARARSLVSLGLTGIPGRNRRYSFLRNLGRWERAVENLRYLHQAPKFFNDEKPGRPYVYLPLHLQPELTSDLLGGEFADQAYLLNHLREFVPHNYDICVKENPKQTSRMRSESFFRALSRLRRVQFLPASTSSFDLIRGATAVATISGTAGWEALRMGKPVLLYGQAFWRNFPGVYAHGRNLQWREVEKFTFDAQLLQTVADDISHFAFPGICDLNYSSLVDNFDRQENYHTLAKSLSSQLDATVPTPQ